MDETISRSSGGDGSRTGDGPGRGPAAGRPREDDWQGMSAHHQQQQHLQPTGIYGWRKRCLYLLVLTLLLMVSLNLALTLWVLKVMEFNTEGMGNIRLRDGGLEVRGESYILGSLVASRISSATERGLLLRAAHNISIASDWPSPHLPNSISLGNDVFEVKASKFRVSDQTGRSLFHADKNEVLIGADLLRISGSGGVVLDGSLQTPLVRANPGSDLRLASPTRALQIMGPSGVTIESRAGAITATSKDTFKLESHDGAIKLEASKILMPTLRTAPVRGPTAGTRGGSQDLSQVYQLCSCGNGKLFLAPGDGICAADNESLVCR